MLAELIAHPEVAFATHGASALKEAIRACVDAALLAKVRDACQGAGLSLLSFAAQRRISELIVGAFAACGRMHVDASGGLLWSHLRKAKDTDGGWCLGSGDAPVNLEDEGPADDSRIVDAEVEGEDPSPIEDATTVVDVEQTPLTPRQVDLLPRLLDTLDISFYARQTIDEPRWSDTGDPVEDDAPLLREALRLETAGKARSGYIADFERKLLLLEGGGRLPKRGRVAATVEREPVRSEPAPGVEMPEAAARMTEPATPMQPADIFGLATDAHPIGTPEPPPVPSHGDVWAEIIADEDNPELRAMFTARRQFGIDKYGTPLRRDNGRDHRNDLAQELLDGIVYARAVGSQATEKVLRDLLCHGEQHAIDILSFGSALRGILFALGVSSVADARNRIDVLRRAEAQVEVLKLRAAQLERQITEVGYAFQHEHDTARRLQEIVHESSLEILLPEGWTVLGDDGYDLADYREQILAIADCLSTIDPDNRARSEGDTTAEQVNAILRRVIKGTGQVRDLARALAIIDGERIRGAKVFLPLSDHTLGRAPGKGTVSASLHFELSQEDALTLYTIITAGGGWLQGAR